MVTLFGAVLLHTMDVTVPHTMNITMTTLSAWAWGKWHACSCFFLVPQLIALLIFCHGTFERGWSWYSCLIWEYLSKSERAAQTIAKLFHSVPFDCLKASEQICLALGDSLKPEWARTIACKSGHDPVTLISYPAAAAANGASLKPPFLPLFSK